MKAPLRPWLVTASLTLPLVACAECAPGKVGQGVSRLTVRNLGAAIELVSSDVRCGFENEAVKAAVQVSASPGLEGTATWNIHECVIDIPLDDPVVKTDCNGIEYSIRGRVVVTATKHVGGLLTGNVESPVIPGGPDAARIIVQRADFTEFSVESSASDSVLTMIDASLSAHMSPRLAADNDPGACSVPTKHVLFTDIVYAPSLVHVKTASRDFDVDVEQSNLTAINGRHSGYENALFGEITVFGELEPIPTSGDVDGLDPEYSLELLESGYACKPALALPPSFECRGFLAPRLAQSASRLSIRLLGRLAHMLEQNTTCGFASTAVQDATQLSGAVGGLGVATMLVDRCVIDLPKETAVKETCDGIVTLASGRVVVSATKRITGRLTGDTVTPAVPMSDSPAEIEIRAEAFDGFVITESGASLRVDSGSISGTLRPRTAADAARSGVCAFATPAARFSDVRWGDASKVALTSASGTFALDVGGSDLWAVNGAWGPDVNLLRGSIVVDGEVFQLPTDPADDGLDPGYSPEKFAEGWQCGTVQLPPSYACEFTEPLVQGASQLTIQTLGKLAQLLDSNSTCGFSSRSVALSPVVTGELGLRGGTAVYRVSAPCSIDLGAGTEIGRDCSGKRTFARGRVEVTGTKTLRGVVSGDPAEPIVPTSRSPAEISLRARFTGFEVWADPGTKRLEVRSGVLSGTVRPRVGIDSATGVCSISTPVATFSDVAYENADVRLTKDGLAFDLQLARSQLEATNGTADGRTNHLSGSIVVDGVSYEIPVDGNPVLDPDFDASVFDASYTCAPGLRVPANEAACDLTQLLGEGVARMLVMASGTMASQINANDDCGFENFWVKTDPSRVVGDSGDLGSIEWDVEACRIGRSGAAAGQPLSVDCLGRERYVSGSFTANAHRTVVGLRETILVLVDSIIPVAHDAVEIALSNVGLQSYRIWEAEGGTPAPFRSLELHSGQLAATVAPITAENSAERGTFDVTTPVVHVTSLHLTNAPVTLTSAGKTFRFHVDSTDLEAFNGSWSGAGMTNFLAGTVTIDGVRVTMGAGGLDPAYTQQSFDARYGCNGGMAALIPPQ